MLYEKTCKKLHVNYEVSFPFLLKEVRLCFRVSQIKLPELVDLSGLVKQTKSISQSESSNSSLASLLPGSIVAARRAAGGGAGARNTNGSAKKALTFLASGQVYSAS